MRLMLACLGTLAILTGTCAAAPKLAPVPPTFRNWTIAFVRDHGVWTSNGDGSGPRQVVKRGAAPCWNPDRRKLAFHRNGDIWVAGADGRGQRQLTHYGAGRGLDPEDITITWSRRTGGITFSRPDCVKGDRTGRTCLLPGSAIIDLYPVTRGKATASVRFDASDTGTGFSFPDNSNPAWSKSGEVLAFTRNGDIWIAQYVPAEDGGRPGWDITRLAAVAVYDSPTWRASRENEAVTHLSWSPDGKHLAYCLNRLGGSGTAELHVIDVAKGETPLLFGEKDVKLLNEFNVGSDSEFLQPKFACFSPDGNWIAFSSCGTVYAVSLDGKRLVKLLSNADQAVW